MTNFAEIFQANFERSRAVKLATLERLQPALVRAAETMVACYQQGGKAIFCGNGGSAADAQHLAAEFVGRYLAERRPLPALALNANSSAVTAIGNDYGYEHAFARQLEALARPGDVVVGITTSGNSANIVEALRRGRALGLATVGLTGEGGGKLRAVADILLDVSSQETPRIQECHILIGHCLCQAVEQALFGG
ncbi:MAG TPA: D-sedoheptulose 7-phosphate isomerase [Terriglobales bacterium]|nr:D-sedoheptulose 7-phosphate isomerase [Terriglobales bacterium]